MMVAVAVAHMPPQQQAVAVLQLQINGSAYGEQHFGGYVPVRQAGDDGRACLAAQPLHDAV